MKQMKKEPFNNKFASGVSYTFSFKHYVFLMALLKTSPMAHKEFMSAVEEVFDAALKEGKKQHYFECCRGGKHKPMRCYCPCTCDLVGSWAPNDDRDYKNV